MKSDFGELSRVVKSVVQFRIRLRLAALRQRSRFRESLSGAKSDKVLGDRSARCAQRNKYGNVRN